MSNQSRGARQLLIMGHRGAREIVPENTLASYRLAMEAGSDALELDVHLSVDGELIVMHDARLDRTTDGNGEICHYTLAELKALNAAATYAGDRNYGVQRIPTLQEVYDLTSNAIPINVEIKTRSDGSRYPGIEAKVVDLARRNNVLDSTMISSFDFPTLETVHSLAPEIRIYGIVAKEYFQRLDPESPGAVVADLAGHGFNWVAVNKAYLTPQLIDGLHQAGITVHAWVINEPAEMWSFVDMGADAITTDRPDILVAAYRQERPR